MQNDNVLTAEHREQLELIERCQPDLLLMYIRENTAFDVALLERVFELAKERARTLLATPQPEPRAEVTHGDTTMDECMASLLDRLEAAELYADRYRYLRERPLDAVSTGGVFAGKTPDNVVLNGADLDAAVDAARTGASS